MRPIRGRANKHMYSPSEYDSVWSAIHDAMLRSGVLSEMTFNIWFKCFQVVYIDDNCIVFSVESIIKRDAIRQHYAAILSQCVKEVTGLTSFDIIVDTASAPPIPGADTVESPLSRTPSYPPVMETAAEVEIPAVPAAPPVVPVPPAQNSVPDQAAREKNESAGRERRLSYNSDYTFDNFIVGESNKFAHAAALAVANNPASTYNPLLFYGPSGLGKTHLMYAIINKLFERSPDMNAIYINGEDFTNQLIEAIARQKNVEFREKYRKADVLLIDDIQFIAGKESTQEEFFHTFNALYRDHKQIIVTSDRPPKEMVTLEDRIRSRFEQGLMADIHEPDYELRIAILKKKAEAMGLTIDDNVLAYIADKLQSNIRQLEGIIKRISATHLLDGKTVDMNLARTLVPMFQQETESVEVTVEKILNAVQARHNVTREDLVGKDRSKPISTARNIAMYLIKQVTGKSSKGIGEIFGNRDHSTIVSNLSSAEKMLKIDPALEAEVNDIRKEIRK